MIRSPHKIETTIPAPSKRQRIASILSGLDAKIASEEKVLEKYEKVKKGMMERLLKEKEYYDKLKNYNYGMDI